MSTLPATEAVTVPHDPLTEEFNLPETEVSCATQGHLWGPLGKCVMCPEVRPVAEDNAALRVGLRNAKHRAIELPDRTVCMAAETYELLLAAEKELSALRADPAIAAANRAVAAVERLERTEAGLSHEPSALHEVVRAHVIDLERCAVILDDWPSFKATAANFRQAAKELTAALPPTKAEK